MTTEIRAEVHKIHGTRNWRVVVGSRTRIHDIDAAPSWPEAMQLAYKLRADIERELMDEVHASRASRRDVHTVEATA